MGESCFIWHIDCCRNMETGKSERNLEKSFIKGRMPGDLKAPGMYYEKVILLLTSARLIK